MPGPAVVNASPLIFLGKTKRLELLRVVGRPLVVPAAVIDEIAQKGAGDEVLQCVTQSTRSGFLQQVPDVLTPPQVVSWRLGAGESAVLAYALQQDDAMVLLDDREGRRCARELGIRQMGTLGLIVLAKDQGAIPLAAPVIRELISSGLFVSQPVLKAVLKLAGEGEDL